MQQADGPGWEHFQHIADIGVRGSGRSLAEAFEQAGALDRLEDFASHFGPDFYGLPRNADSVTLEQTDWQVPDSYPLAASNVIPMYAGETLHWRLKDQ